MSVGFSFSRFSSSCTCFCLLLFIALFHLCLSNTNSNSMLCMSDERQALLRFKHGLIDDAGRLASWVPEENSDCCKWAGIVCDNVTGHVHEIHLQNNFHFDDDDYYEDDDDDDDDDDIYNCEECEKQKLRGDISPSLLNLKQLKHLDLSNNAFEGKQIPKFMGSLVNLRYLNLSNSHFVGRIPPQLGNLSELRTLSLGSFCFPYESPSYSMMNMHWLSGLRFLHHLDMSGVDLSNVIDWLQVINTLPSLVELHLSNCQLMYMHPHVDSLNLTSLSVLDLSNNYFSNSFVPRWIFSITSLVSLDLSWCDFLGFIPSSSEGFHNMTSLELLHVSGNAFMNSSIVIKGLSGSNLISLDISVCSVSSLVLNSLHNLSALQSLDLTGNQLTKTIPRSLGNLCSLRVIDLSFNRFDNISLTFLLESFFECKSPRLESLSIERSGLSSRLPDQLGQLINLVYLRLDSNRIVGTIPDSIGRLAFLKYLKLDNNLISGEIPFSVGGLLSLELLRVSNNQLNGSLPYSIGRLAFLKYLMLHDNLISGQIPFSVGGLSSLEVLWVSNNQLNGSLPDGLGLLSNLIDLDISNNSLTGVVTDAHFNNLNRLKYLSGWGNNLTLRPRLPNWHPHFRLKRLSLNSWDIGPQFPLWLLKQSDLSSLDISNTRISSTMPLSFWGSFPNLESLFMSQNHIQGRLLGIPRTLVTLDVSYNKFSGQLPELPNSSRLTTLYLSYNSFVGMLHPLIWPYCGKELILLDVANNHLSGAIPNKFGEKFPYLIYLGLENNNLSGGIPGTLGSLYSLQFLNMCNNKLSGSLPISLKNLKRLYMLQLAGNRFVGRIPAWFGTEFSNLRILNLRSNNFEGNIPHELCYLTRIHILDFSHNNLSGVIPRCFNNFTILSGGDDTFYDPLEMAGSASLVIKGREYEYSTTLGLVLIMDLSSNKFSGHIPSELMALRALQSLNLSRNQLRGGIPKNIGDMKSLESFDVSLNGLSGELPVSLSSLNFLSSFNVSYNNFTGRVPTSTQLQSFSESSFFSNKLCGDPLPKSCAVAVPYAHHEEEKDGPYGADWGLIISMVCGFIAGFWVVLVPLIVSPRWRIAYFDFLGEFKYMV